MSKVIDGWISKKKRRPVAGDDFFSSGDAEKKEEGKKSKLILVDGPPLRDCVITGIAEISNVD